MAIEVFINEGASSSVQIGIPTESISESFTLANGLTTETALRDDLLTSIQATAAITQEFTASADVAPSGITGVPTGSPIVKLVANDFTDHAISFSFMSGEWRSHRVSRWFFG